MAPIYRDAVAQSKSVASWVTIAGFSILDEVDVRLVAGILFGWLLIVPALAQDVLEITVVGVAPADSGMELNRIPQPVQVADSDDIADAGAVSLADFMRGDFAGVSLNDAQNNPLQPDLQYRGFTASPLLGLAQGIAVYQNGARVNEPLGDTVNWDLLPQSAIDRIALTGGAAPLFGLNSLGGALAVTMKDGFSHQGGGIDVSGGSFGRSRAGVEFGGNNGAFGYYLDLEDFREDGWRDHSASEASNIYGSLGWRGADSQVNLNYQHGESDLTGNGSSPIELLALNRAAIFTGPDITAHNMDSASLDFDYRPGTDTAIGGNLYFRRNRTRSFNGDASEFEICEFAAGARLVEGLEGDDLAELGLDEDDLCEGRFANAEGLEDFLNETAAALGEHGAFDIEAIENEELSGTGVLADGAINNISGREQTIRGADFQWTASTNPFGRPSRIVVGASWYEGESDFDSRLELAAIDPLTRLTTGLGTGTFVDGEATLIRTKTASSSLYISAATELNDAWTLTTSARANSTDVKLRDLSGERPELNGAHAYSRVNPSIGLVWLVDDGHSLYASVGESNRAPTPIELACNEYVYDLAVEYAVADGGEADDIDFECRLPNAFLADPPLEDVVARYFEFGARGRVGAAASYNLSLFRTDNKNDILFQTTGRATGLFANIDRSRRQGIEGRLAGRLGGADWFASYSFVAATFQDDFQVLSPNHDFADEAGEIAVGAGDRIPGIPAHQFKFGADYALGDRLTLSLDVIANSSQPLRGDESNQLAEIDGHTLVNLGARYRAAERLLIYAQIHNLFDAEFETFGLLGEEPGEVEVLLVEDFTQPIFLGAAPPRAAFLGLRYQFQLSR